MKLVKTGARSIAALGLSLGGGLTLAANMNATVKDVRTGGDGRVTFTTVETPLNPAGCGSTSYYDAQVDNATKYKLAVLLMAQASGRMVRLEIKDTACGVYDRPIVDYIVIVGG